MTFVEITLMAWVCDVCGLEALSADDCLPEGWALLPNGEQHACPLHISAAVLATVQ